MTGWPLDNWKHSPIAGHNCPPGRLCICHPITLECPAMTMAGSHFQLRWQNMWRTRPELESYLWRKQKQGDSIIQLLYATALHQGGRENGLRKMIVYTNAVWTLTNLAVGYANESLIYKFVSLGVSGLTLHDVTLSSFIGQWNGRNLKDKRIMPFMQECDLADQSKRY